MTFQKISGERTTWIDIGDPTIHDVGTLKRYYPDLHPLNLEDILSPIERPKIDEHDDYLFVVMHFPLFDATNRLSRPSEVNFFVGRGYIITVHDDRLKPLRKLFETARENKQECVKLLGSSSAHAFYMIVDRLVDYVFPILNKVEANIRALEETLFDVEGMELIRNIALVRRDIIALRRIIRQQVPILEMLERTKHPIIHEDMEEYFGDIVDHIRRARDIIDEDVEIISGISDTADTLLSHRLNGVIRILTIFSVIMLPLTFVTSLFGMNVALPMQEHPDAFPYISIIMVLIAALMLLYFRYRRWL